MFLLVLVFIFLAAQIMVKNRERIGDEEEDGLIEFDGCHNNDGIDTLVGVDKEIFFINPSENMMSVETSSSFQDKSEIKVRNSLIQSLKLKERVSMGISNWLPEKFMKLL